MFLPLGDLLDPGIRPLSLASPALKADSLLLGHQGLKLYDGSFLQVLFVKFFFFNHEKLMKFLSCPLCINWDHGFSLRYVNVVHCLLACLLCKALQSCPTLCDPHGQQPTRLLCPQDSLGMNSGVGCHFLLQRGAWYQCILQWWSILAFQEKSHLCIL